MYGINIDREKLAEIAGALGCRTGEGTIPYLGLRVGGRLKGTEGWREVLDKVKNKLRG